MSDNDLILKVLTPEGTAFEGTVEAVFVPGYKGRFEVLPGHAPIISSLEMGDVVWRAGGKESSLAIRYGALILEHNELKLCVQVV
ncbi:MAG: F0F1 ATP synthase subunit epsilon [Bacteroidales bacterium]|nr:F0F1 ATP synthase subunit epsilon [Bacteroidales bacterium]